MLSFFEGFLFNGSENGLRGNFSVINSTKVGRCRNCLCALVAMLGFFEGFLFNGSDNSLEV